MVTFEVLNMVFRGLVLTTAKSTYHKETFAKKRFAKFCNRKSQQGVKDENFAEIELDFILIVTFEVFDTFLDVLMSLDQK